jgi:hypothetical protein
MVENKPLISRSHVFTGLLTPAGDTNSIRASLQPRELSTSVPISGSCWVKSRSIARVVAPCQTLLTDRRRESRAKSYRLLNMKEAVARGSRGRLPSELHGAKRSCPIEGTNQPQRAINFSANEWLLLGRVEVDHPVSGSMPATLARSKAGVKFRKLSTPEYERGGGKGQSRSTARLVAVCQRLLPDRREAQQSPRK